MIVYFIDNKREIEQPKQVFLLFLRVLLTQTRETSALCTRWGFVFFPSHLLASFRLMCAST